MLVSLTLKSGNAKVGPIPVSTSSEDTCPTSCGMYRECYAKMGPLRIHWWAVTDGRRGDTWGEFNRKIGALPVGQLWRHNQAGDLPGVGDKLDTKALGELVKANRGRRGFTYTHKPLTTAAERKAVAKANAGGFTVNLSADTLADARRPWASVLWSSSSRLRRLPTPLLPKAATWSSARRTRTA